MKIKKFFKRILDVFMFMYYLFIATFFLPALVKALSLYIFKYQISTAGFIILSIFGFIIGLLGAIGMNDYLFEKITNMPWSKK